jgi:phosphate-selective porin
MTKSITYGLLAMAVSTSLALANGGEDEKGKKNAFQGTQPVSWKPGSGITFDGGDEFRLTFSNMIQVQYEYHSNEDATNVHSFRVRRARTNFTGNIFNKNITYRLSLDAVDSGASGDGNIKQGWIRWAFSDSETGQIGLMVGQAKSMYGLEATGTSSSLTFVERSLASRTFSDTYNRGAWVDGNWSDSALRVVVGAMNNDVAAGTSFDSEEGANAEEVELSYVAMANYDVTGNLPGKGKAYTSYKQGDFEQSENWAGTVGVGIAMANNSAAGGVQTDSTSYNLNTAWHGQGFNILAEYFGRSDEPDGATGEDSSGFNAAVGYILAKAGDSTMQWGFGARYSMIETDDTNTFLTAVPIVGDVTELSLGLNAFYNKHLCKTQLEYTMQDVSPTGGSDVTNHLIRIQVTLQF